MVAVVGVDIAKRTFDLAISQPNGKHRTKSKLDNDKSGLQSSLIGYSGMPSLARGS